MTAIVVMAMAACTTAPDHFTIHGTAPLPDGYRAGLVVQTDTAYSVTLVEDVVIADGHFEMSGSVKQPLRGTLMTNNLALVEANGWPVDSIRWTYTEVFVTNGELDFAPVGTEADGTPVFALTGTEVQADFNALQAAGGEQGADPWAFIEAHSRSAVSVWLATHLLQRAYRLTAEQLQRLETTITSCPADTARFAQFRRQAEAYRSTVMGAPLTDLELTDTAGHVCHLVGIVPQGKYVLIDFWASWCGICLHQMPEVARLAEDYADELDVVSISIDTDAAAWSAAMAKHPEPWPQYRTTEQGYADLFTRYQVGNGVPYYLLLAPNGTVLCSPDGPEEARELIMHN